MGAVFELNAVLKYGSGQLNSADASLGAVVVLVFNYEL